MTDRNRTPITIVYRTLRSANRSERTVQNYIESVALLSAFRPGTVRPLFAQPRRYRAQVATIDDVARIVAGLPEVTDGERHGYRTWSVTGKTFAWERPFSKADLKRYGDAVPPDGPILAVRVEDLGEKEAVLAEGRRGFFTIPHFDGYAAVLIQLRTVSRKALREALVDGWLACAPGILADDFLTREWL